MDLLQKSDQVKRQADKILRESGLQDILSLYGNVRITGSYLLNVMLRPDLDIYAVAEKNDGVKMREVVAKIFASNYFEEICFANWVDFHQDEKDIKGYYIQPKISLSGRKWKLDVWLMEESQFKPYTQEFLDLIKDDPESQKRLAILTLKEKLAEGSKYIKGVDGKLIYEAVLKRGIRTEEEFRSFLASK